MNDTTGHRADAIEKDIVATQDGISDTIDELQERLTPHSLVKSIFGDESEGSDRIVDMARRNPLAVGLIGAGALWLATGQKVGLPSFGGDKPRRRRMRDHRHQSYVDHMAEVMPQENEPEQAYRRRRDIARSNYFMLERGHDEDESGFRKRLDDMGEKLRSRTSALGDEARQQGRNLTSGLSDAGDAAASAGSKAIHTTQRLYGENPVIGGLIAAAIGAVVGVAIPATRTEEEELGGVGKAAIGKATEKTDEAAAEAKRQLEPAD